MMKLQKLLAVQHIIYCFRFARYHISRDLFCQLQRWYHQFHYEIQRQFLQKSDCTCETKLNCAWANVRSDSGFLYGSRDFICCKCFFSVKISSSITGIALMILLIFMTAFFLSGLAYFISLSLPNEVIYETIMTAIILPIFFLSTALFPLENLSGGLAIAVKLNPFTYIISALRSLIFGEIIVFWHILPVILLFAVLCCISFALAIWRLKKETAQ